jgi:hypothetical protein
MEMSEDNGSVGAGAVAQAPPAEGISPAETLPSSADASVIGRESAPVAVNYVGADGSFSPDWTQRLPEEFAPSRESLGRYKNVQELAKAYVNVEKAVGKKGVIIPTADSPPEEVANFRKVMGVPESPAEYGDAIKPNVVLPEGVTWDETLAMNFYEVAHKHNIPAAALTELAQLDLKKTQFQQEAAINLIQEQKQEGLQKLRQTWGANFDRNIALAQRAAATVGVDPNSFGFRDVEVVKAFVRMASMMGEKSLVSSAEGLPAGSTDFAQRAKDIQTNPQNPLYKRYQNGDPDIQNMVRQYLIKGGK